MSELPLEPLPWTPLPKHPNREQLDRRLAEMDIHEYMRQAWRVVESSPFRDNWHIQGIGKHLEAVTEGRIKKLLVNIPPGCCKSLLTSVFWPTWAWIRRPWLRWFYSSYDQKLSTRDSVKCRAIVESDWYQSRWGDRFGFRGDQNLKVYYETSKGGYRLATSVGGHGTGEHPHFVIVDDPHSVEEAESAASRQSVKDWWTLTMATRGIAVDVGSVGICQRTHEDDWSALVLQEGTWDHIRLPMRFEADARMRPTSLGWTDPRTQEGELLWPSLFTEAKVEEIESRLRLVHGNYGVAGQLQQRPAPREGGMFKRNWFGICDAIPAEASRVRYWDKAGVAGGGDYTCGLLMSMTQQGIFTIEDVVRGQWSAHDRNEIMRQTAELDRQKHGNGVVIWTEQEPGSGGKESAEYTVKDLAGFVVKVHKVSKSKEVRAEPLAAQAEAGNVRMLRAEWNRDFLDEIQVFPNGKHDDQCDAASGSFNKLALMHLNLHDFLDKMIADREASKPKPDAPPPKSAKGEMSYSSTYEEWHVWLVENGGRRYVYTGADKEMALEAARQHGIESNDA